MLNTSFICVPKPTIDQLLSRSQHLLRMFETSFDNKAALIIKCDQGELHLFFQLCYSVVEERGQVSMKCIIIVRDTFADHKSDYDLRCLEAIYESPHVELNFEANRDKAMDEFEEKYRKYYSNFFAPKFEIVPLR